MTQKRQLLALAIIAATAGCSSTGYTPVPPKEVPKADVAAGKEATLWPLAVGNQWVYSVTIAGAQGSQEREITFKVVDSRKEGDRTYATIETTDGTKHLDTSEWAVDSKGIYQVSSGDKKLQYTPPQMIAKFPVKSGESFKQSVTGPTSVTGQTVVPQDVVTECLGMEQIDTDQGRLEGAAYRSQTTFTYQNVQVMTQATVWFVPNIGLARLVQETRAKNAATKEIFRLKSHTAK